LKRESSKKRTNTSITKRILRTIINIHCNNEHNNVGKHKGWYQPWEPLFKEPKITITTTGDGGRRRRIRWPRATTSMMNGGIITGRINVNFNGATIWVPPSTTHDDDDDDS
jgi:hypothetical protein